MGSENWKRLKKGLAMALFVGVGAYLLQYVDSRARDGVRLAPESDVEDWEKASESAILDRRISEEEGRELLLGFDRLSTDFKFQGLRRMLSLEDQDPWTDLLRQYSVVAAMNDRDRAETFWVELSELEREMIGLALVRGMAVASAERTWNWLDSLNEYPKESLRAYREQVLLSDVEQGGRPVDAAQRLSQIVDPVERLLLYRSYASLLDVKRIPEILDTLRFYDDLDLSFVDAITLDWAQSDLEAAVEWVLVNEALATEGLVGLLANRFAAEFGTLGLERMERGLSEASLRERLIREAVSWHAQNDVSKLKEWFDRFDSDEMRESAAKSVLFEMGDQVGLLEQARFVTETFEGNFSIRRDLLHYSLSGFIESNRKEVARYVKSLSGKDHAMYLEMEEFLRSRG